MNTGAKRSPPASHNEWDPLEEIIIGSAVHARLPWNDGGMNKMYPEARHSLPSETERRYPDWIIEQAEEDIDALVQTLEQLDVVVRRPEPIDFDGVLHTPDWSADFYSYSYPPRDVLLVIGDLFIETAKHGRVA